METPSRKPFPTLTEREYDQVRDVWRTMREKPMILLQRYREISLALLPGLAERLCCAVEAVPALYQDLLAHAVVAAAIEDHFLSGSLTGELIMGTYFEGGGSVYLAAYGRLCFCSAFTAPASGPSSSTSVCSQIPSLALHRRSPISRSG